MKKYIVSLTPEERLSLNEIISKRNAKSVTVKRAYILLAADTNGDNLKDDEIAKRYKAHSNTVANLREALVTQGLAIALNGKKRAVTTVPKFDASVETQLVTLRCSAPPEGYNHWSLRLLRDQMIILEYVEDISHETVRNILKKTKLNLGK